MTGIKNIIFDISGVFVNNIEDELLSNYADKYSLTKEEVKKAYKKDLQYYEENKISFDNFKMSFFSGINQPVDPNFINVWVGLKKRDEDMYKLLNKLKKHVKCFYLSNEATELWQIQKEKIRIDEGFDGGVICAETGISKPDKRIFEFLCNKYNVDPQETIFTDDKIKNTIGAKQLGMTVLEFKSVEKLKEELSKHGIPIS